MTSTIWEFQLDEAAFLIDILHTLACDRRLVFRGLDKIP